MVLELQKKIKLNTCGTVKLLGYIVAVMPAKLKSFFVTLQSYC